MGQAYKCLKSAARLNALSTPAPEEHNYSIQSTVRLTFGLRSVAGSVAIVVQRTDRQASLIRRPGRHSLVFVDRKL